MTTVVEDLLTITKIEHSEEETTRETTQVFLNRMVAAINQLSEEDWGKIPEPGKAWFNEAAKIIEGTDENGEYELPSIPGMEDDKDSKVSLDSMELEVAAMEPKEQEKVPEPEVTKETKPKKKRVGPPVTQIARELFCADISMSLDDLIELLNRQNVHIKKSTAQVVYLNTLRAYETAQKLGEVKKNGKVVLKAVS